MTEEKPYPEQLSKDELSSLLFEAETLFSDLVENRLGGYSGINRPFFILSAFKEVIEKYGHRDVGLQLSLDALESHPDHKK